MVSEKMKEKEKEKVAAKPKTVVSAPATYSESLQVSPAWSLWEAESVRRS